MFYELNLDLQPNWAIEHQARFLRNRVQYNTGDAAENTNITPPSSPKEGGDTI